MSTTVQLLDRQLRALDDAGCTKVFSDQLSGRDADRPQLQACLANLRGGDTLVVPSLDRLSRSLQDLITLVAELRRRGIRVPDVAREPRHHPPVDGWCSTSSPRSQSSLLSRHAALPTSPPWGRLPDQVCTG